VRYSGWRKEYNILGFKLKIKFKPTCVDEINLNFDEKVGIGNRIFGLVNVINYFQPKKINLFWDDKNWVNEKLFNLFDLNFSIEINEINDFSEFQKFSSKNITINTPPCDLRTKHGKKLAFLYNSIENQDIEEFKQYFKNILPSKSVQKRLKDVVLPDNCIALQIRNNPDWAEYGRNEELELFYQQIDSLDKDNYFYLSAMNGEISGILKERYKNRIIELPNKSYSSMIDAVADLYVLGKCEKAIYSYGSTFSELAFWLSECKQEVITVGKGMNWIVPDKKELKNENKVFGGR
jgi:hypothetical protein